ncbi:MAG: hypothetical protein NT154_41530, partial [Verrucomicrobia bacterium]|nr:hypothetical protein [Verrucomicrobiota bacterium]
LSELDQVVVALLRVCPNGGELQKAGAGEVVPSGRSKVPGFGAEMRGNHGEFVALWFTTAEAKLDPKSEVSGTSEYMGRMRGNFVYFALDGKTRTLWPTVTEDICRALQITK